MPCHNIDYDTDFTDVQGVVLEMDEANTRAACGLFLNCRVAIWAADELVPRAGSPAMEPTPENMQHLVMRLEAAEEHLAREVRCNQAAALVRADLEARLALANTEVDRLAAELADAISSVARYKEAVGASEC